MKKVALVGNPNVGKSVIFNALTGGRQSVGGTGLARRLRRRRGYLSTRVWSFM